MDGVYAIHLDVTAGKPGMALSAEDASNWRRTFAHRCYLEDFSDARLALPVGIALNQARAQQLFETIEAWARPPYESRNPEVVFVGINGNHHTLIAQWSPQEQLLTTNAQLRKRFDTLHHPFLAAFGFPWRAQAILAMSVGALLCSLAFWDWRLGLLATIIPFMGLLGTTALAQDDREVGRDILYTMTGAFAVTCTVMILERLYP